ncbi:hypothetical protein N836_05020 [Leptolyngbya sp. Heron Island J]|nr:hypothetical protein N836_05020 [Leptolyngbya sp. Heron Island J]
MLSAINPALPALTFGKPETVIEIEKPITVILDAHGRAEKYDPMERRHWISVGLS